jgi:hypothetical protein
MNNPHQNSRVIVLSRDQIVAGNPEVEVASDSAISVRTAPSGWVGSARGCVGWSAWPRMTTDLALQVLLAAVWRRSYRTRGAARQDVFAHIKMFYNPKRKQTNNRMLSPVDFETRQQKLNEAGV